MLLTLKVGDIIFPPPLATSIKITCTYVPINFFIYIAKKCIKIRTKIFKLILVFTRGTANTIKKTAVLVYIRNDILGDS